MSICSNINEEEVKDIENCKIKFSNRKLYNSEYSQEEIDFLLKYYKKIGAKTCSDVLQRGLSGLQVKAAQLNLRKKPIWTSTKIQFLTENYPNKGAAFCSKHLGFSKTSVRCKAQHLNLKITQECNANLIKERVILTDEQVKFVEDNYEKYGGKYCADILNVKQRLVNGLATRLNIKREEIPHKREKSNLDINKFLNLTDFHTIYILGLIWADGYLKETNNEIRIHCVYEDIVSLAPSFYELGHWNTYDITPKSYYKGQNNKKQLAFSASNKIVHKFLRDNDFYEKSILSPDKILSKILPELHYIFYRGWFDGDGTISFLEDGRGVCQEFDFSIAGNYQQNWNALHLIFRKLNIEYYSICRTINKDKSKSSRCASKDKKDVLRFLDYIYQGEIYPCLGRKYLLYKRLKSHLEYIQDNPYFYAFQFKSNGKEKYTQDKYFDYSE